MIRAQFEDSFIKITSYPFAAASVAAQPVIPTSAIREVNLDREPPQVVLKNHEVVFIPQEKKEELTLFSERNAIPIVQREDVWALINVPLVQKEEDDITLSRNKEALAQYGFSEKEIEEIRAKIQAPILAHHILHANWQMGLFDLLCAKRRFGLPNGLNRKFYKWTMAIATRNKKY